uniref:outer membrane protein assembly factor BamB family protein n=1 Tax=Sphingobium fuliginis (strain ATCC 27551) TaxID=336203 RepID=UPI0020C79683|nr:PQQ-binding-like beta-propeller repeat protein [Sphingobium fuliginis]
MSLKITSSFRRSIALASLISVATGALHGAATAAPSADADWAAYGRDPGGARHSPLRQITTANVGTLRQAWVYHMRPPGVTADAGPMPDGMRAKFATGFSASEATPLVVDGVMYLATPYNRVVALDAATGKERWAYTLANKDQPSTRGVAYWPGARGNGARIFFGTRSGKLIALDAATGQPAAAFGEAGIVNMKTPEVMNGLRAAPLGMSSPPAIYKDLVITGSRVQEMPVKGAAGDVRAWDARTGKLVWTFHTIRRRGRRARTVGRATARRRDRAPMSGPSCRSMKSAASPICRSARRPSTAGALTERAPISIPTRWSRWTRRPANISGISRPCITTSGTLTCRR